MDLKDAILYDIKETRNDLFDLLLKDTVTSNLVVRLEDIADVVNPVVNKLMEKLQPIVDNGFPHEIKLVREIEEDIRMEIIEQISDGLVDLQMYVLKKLNKKTENLKEDRKYAPDTVIKT